MSYSGKTLEGKIVRIEYDSASYGKGRYNGIVTIYTDKNGGMDKRGLKISCIGNHVNADEILENAENLEKLIRDYNEKRELRIWLDIIWNCPLPLPIWKEMQYSGVIYVDDKPGYKISIHRRRQFYLYPLIFEEDLPDNRILQVRDDINDSTSPQ